MLMVLACKCLPFTLLGDIICRSCKYVTTLHMWITVWIFRLFGTVCLTTVSNCLLIFTCSTLTMLSVGNRKGIWPVKPWSSGPQMFFSGGPGRACSNCRKGGQLNGNLCARELVFNCWMQLTVALMTERPIAQRGHQVSEITWYCVV